MGFLLEAFLLACSSGEVDVHSSVEGKHPSVLHRRRLVTLVMLRMIRKKSHMMS